MKRYFAVLLSLLLLVSSLCGCMNDEKNTVTSTSSVINESEKASPIPSKEPESQKDTAVSENPPEPDSTPSESDETEITASPTPSQEPESEETNDNEEINQSAASENPEENEESESTASFESYTVKVKYVGNYIFSEPDFDSTPVSPMPVGTFTITEEITDKENNKWGKLKSGAGYVCLSGIEKEISPVAIGEADRAFLESGKYTSYGAESPYTIPIVIQSTENLTKVTFVTLEIFEGEAGAGDVLMHWEEMEGNTFSVMWVEFPGDMSAYGISLTDEEGNFLRYEIYQSGKDGTVQAVNPDL